AIRIRAEDQTAAIKAGGFARKRKKLRLLVRLIPNKTQSAAWIIADQGFTQSEHDLAEKFVCVAGGGIDGMNHKCIICRDHLLNQHRHEQVFMWNTHSFTT